MPVRKAKHKDGMSVGADKRYHDEGQDTKGKQPAQAPDEPSRILNNAVAVAKSDWNRHLASTPHNSTEANYTFRAIMDDMEDAHKKALQALSQSVAAALNQQQACGGTGVMVVRLDKASEDDLVTRFDDKLKILHRLHEEFVASRLETHHRGMRSHMSAIGNRVISGREIANAPVLPDEYAVRTDATPASAGESSTTTTAQQTVAAAAVSTVAPPTTTKAPLRTCDCYNETHAPPPPPPLFTTRVSATELNSLGSMRPNKGRKSGGHLPDTTPGGSSSHRETRSYTPSPPRRDEKKRRVERGN
ncbi:hypothetical protein MAPG_09418 [Magnaporthiopsis poae ATCC 64411]|uniref:Uncharacterized protein n=1 Tax=Magnaporthiopsis poae (strain ATCC 64411 / 73-15) TaxID=644358 RepID=A0A0C4E9W8_MAGP6|nr:hypothetical protein MAPG_09418 [Magnaporthiopsis poae ATCC 64411]